MRSLARSLRLVGVIVITIPFACSSAVHAQDANPISTNLRASWSNIRDLLTKMADEMPTENYRFKPTPEIQDFGQRMGHAIITNMRACAALKGDTKTITLSAMPSKDEIVSAMKQANDECDSLMDSLTDADVLRFVSARGGQRLELGVIEGMIEHSQENNGYLDVYLRIKGIVPPSSDRNEQRAR